jgi:hypothetical protein
VQAPALSSSIQQISIFPTKLNKEVIEAVKTTDPYHMHMTAYLMEIAGSAIQLLIRNGHLDYS